MRRPGATIVEPDSQDPTRLISILTRCEDRVLRRHEHGKSAGLQISILTRCEDRVLPAHPDDANSIKNISILTRCEDRVLPGSRTPHKHTAQYFNPHPVRRPGATKRRRIGLHLPAYFNPPPVRRPGATNAVVLLVSVSDEFQSSPGAKTGCYFRRTGTTRSAL